MVMELLERMEPDSLKHFLAMMGSCDERGKYMDDGDVALIRSGCLECVIAFEDIDEGMLPVGNRIHIYKFKLQRMMVNLI